MIVVGGWCVAGALVTGLFVSDDRLAGPRLVPHPRAHACAPSVPSAAAAA
jgi:hypothetical protein